MRFIPVTVRPLLGAVLLAVSYLQSAQSVSAEQGEPLFYRNPMNPVITSPVPAKDSMGMDYIPVYADASGADPVVVSIDPGVVQNLGVRTEAVSRGSFSRRIDTVGSVAYNENHMVHIHMRAKGWIEHLATQYVGESVQAGAVLFEIYSPELSNAQEEFLQVLRVGQTDLIEASRERLRLLGIDAQQVREIERTRRSTARITVRAPQAGVVTELNVREGMYVTPDVEIMNLADLSSIWLIADVYERQAAWLAVGQKAEVRLSSLPGEVYEGTVEFIYPSIDPQTRTVRARLHFDNPGQTLKPGMYANVQIATSPLEDVLSVPRQALIRSGRTDRVIVALGEGKFSAAEIVAGVESGDAIEVISGLKDSDRVVVSGQFLIDSEASIKASVMRMQSESAADADADAAKGIISGEGKVTAIMAEQRMLTIEHAPIAALGWPAMSMDFKLGERADIGALKVGSRIHFSLLQDKAGAYEIDQVHVME